MVELLLGTERRPFEFAPDDWDANGLPYGAFCRCVRCHYVGRSTVSFDFSATGAGEPLTCDRCKLGVSTNVDLVMRKEIREGRLDTDPLPGSA